MYQFVIQFYSLLNTKQKVQNFKFLFTSSLPICISSLTASPTMNVSPKGCFSNKFICLVHIYADFHTFTKNFVQKGEVTFVLIMDKRKNIFKINKISIFLCTYLVGPHLEVDSLFLHNYKVNQYIIT